MLCTHIWLRIGYTNKLVSIHTYTQSSNKGRHVWHPNLKITPKICFSTLKNKTIEAWWIDHSIWYCYKLKLVLVSPSCTYIRNEIFLSFNFVICTYLIDRCVGFYKRIYLLLSLLVYCKRIVRLGKLCARNLRGGFMQWGKLIPRNLNSVIGWHHKLTSFIKIF